MARNIGAAHELNAVAAKYKNIHVVEIDMDDLKSIQVCASIGEISCTVLIALTHLQKAAETVGKINGGKLDILINNGALMQHERAVVTLDA